MRIDRISLKGITRFVDPVTVDLRDVPAGIIAVVGPNGAGKTTLLESMFAAFYGEMPSRSDRPLIDAVGSTTDAFIDVEASFTGRGAYRGRINLDGVRRTKDAVLEHIAADGSRRILTDGKISTYQAKVAELLPSPEVLLASAFAAQNKKGSFATADRKARKDLFSALLGHDHFETMATTARSAAALVNAQVTGLTGQLAALAPLTTTAMAEAIATEGNDLQAERLALAEKLAAAQDAVRAAEARLRQCREDDDATRQGREQLARATQARETYQRDIARLEAQIVARGEACTAARQQIARTRTQRLAALDREAAAIPTDEALTAILEEERRVVRGVHDTGAQDFRTRIVNNERLRGEADAVRADVEALDRAEFAVAEQQEPVRLVNVAHGAALVALNDAETALARLAGAEDRLLAGERAAALIEQVPFGERCAEANCGFVSAAVDAKRSLPELQAAVEARTAARQTVTERRQAVETAAQAQHNAMVELRRRQDAATAAAATDPRGRQARLDAAEERLIELQTDLARLEDTYHATMAQITVRGVTRRTEAQATRERIGHDRAMVEVDAQLETDAAERIRSDEQQALTRDAQDTGARLLQVEDEIAALAGVADRAVATAAALAAADTALGLRRADFANLSTLAARNDAAIDAFTRRRDDFMAHMATRERLEATVTRLQTELIEWQALDKVFGRNGLPVFEIDAAGPGVSALANDLLQACFGGRFSLELVTQEAKAGGKGLKETFDIKVWDAERGGEARDLSDLSGGEQVIVDEALKSALALYANQRSPLPVETCWRDESAGALRPETALRYLAMLRRIRERGGFHHLFLVTHNPELAAQADAQIIVADGTATVVFAPFPPFEASDVDGRAA